MAFSFDVGRFATLYFSIKISFTRQKRAITWWNKAAPSKSQVEVSVEPGSYFANNLSIILVLTEQQNISSVTMKCIYKKSFFRELCAIRVSFSNNLIQNMTSYFQKSYIKEVEIKIWFRCRLWHWHEKQQSVLHDKRPKLYCSHFSLMRLIK